jgi:hypothetical protein
MERNIITTAGGPDMIPITPNAPPEAPPRFPLGRVLMTPNAARRIPWQALKDGLRRHWTGDWGDLDPQDARCNDDALVRGGRLLSAYGQDGQRFRIVTEADRTVTSILLPGDDSPAHAGGRP